MTGLVEGISKYADAGDETCGDAKLDAADADTEAPTGCDDWLTESVDGVGRLCSDSTADPASVAGGAGTWGTVSVIYVSDPVIWDTAAE